MKTFPKSGTIHEENWPIAEQAGEGAESGNRERLNSDKGRNI